MKTILRKIKHFINSFIMRCPSHTTIHVKYLNIDGEYTKLPNDTLALYDAPLYQDGFLYTVNNDTEKLYIVKLNELITTRSVRMLKWIGLFNKIRHKRFITIDRISPTAETIIVRDRIFLNDNETIDDGFNRYCKLLNHNSPAAVEKIKPIITYIGE